MTYDETNGWIFSDEYHELQDLNSFLALFRNGSHRTGQSYAQDWVGGDVWCVPEIPVMCGLATLKDVENPCRGMNWKAYSFVLKNDWYEPWEIPPGSPA